MRTAMIARGFDGFQGGHASGAAALSRLGQSMAEG